ncbi:MAG: hypothetical protein NUV97_00525 [archaeon]|nr:hypothetical protein [archaeon]
MAEGDHWKTVAIIFIVLFVLETIVVLWLFSIGTNAIDNETECSVNICGGVEGVVSYYYDDYEQVCYCIDSNGDDVKQQFIR